MKNTLAFRIKGLFLTVFSVLLLSWSANGSATEHNHACADTIQSKIARNEAGDKFWKDENLAELCANTKKRNQPGQFFQQVMTEHVSWGGGESWKWENAINFCAGTNDADERIVCFKGRVASKVGWQEAIFQCQRSGKPVS